MVCVTSVSSSF